MKVTEIPEQLVSLKLQIFTMLKFLRRKNSSSSDDVTGRVLKRSDRRRKSLDIERVRGPLSPSLVVFEEKRTGEPATDAVDGSGGGNAGTDEEKVSESGPDVARDTVMKLSSASPGSPDGRDEHSEQVWD